MEIKRDFDEREKQVNAFLADRSVTQEDIVEFYGGWSKTYDEDMSIWCWQGQKFLDDFEEVTGLTKEARILDVAAGTGLLGEKLAERGYKDIDAIDGSEAMLQRAREKGVYKNCIHSWITSEPIEHIPYNSYDALICFDAMDYNHINYKCFESLIAVTKPGGYIYIVCQMENLEPEVPEFLLKMRELEVRKMWDWILMKKTKIAIYEDDLGVAFAFKVVKKQEC